MGNQRTTYLAIGGIILALTILIGGYALFRVAPWSNAGSNPTKISLRDVFSRPVTLASGVRLQARRTQQGQAEVLLTGPAGKVKLPLQNAAVFHASTSAPDVVAVHHRYSERADEMLVIDLSGEKPRHVKIPHTETTGFTHVRFSTEEVDSAGRFHITEHQQNRLQPSQNRWRKSTITMKGEAGQVQRGQWQQG